MNRPDSYQDGVGVWRCVTCLRFQPCGQDHSTITPPPLESPQFGIDPMAEILEEIRWTISSIERFQILREHIRILREMQTPEDIVAIAEKVLRAALAGETTAR